MTSSTGGNISLGGAQSPFPSLGIAPPLPPGPPPPQQRTGPPLPPPAPPSFANNPIEQVRSGIILMFPDSDRTMSREVEDEANSYFQRIYNHPPHPTLYIDEEVELLKKFQTSGRQTSSAWSRQRWQLAWFQRFPFVQTKGVDHFAGCGSKIENLIWIRAWILALAYLYRKILHFILFFTGNDLAIKKILRKYIRI